MQNNFLQARGNLESRRITFVYPNASEFDNDLFPAWNRNEYMGSQEIIFEEDGASGKMMRVAGTHVLNLPSKTFTY